VASFFGHPVFVHVVMNVYQTTVSCELMVSDGGRDGM